jgi:hypothetical protein
MESMRESKADNNPLIIFLITFYDCMQPNEYDLQNTKDWATRTPLKTVSELSCSRRVCSSCPNWNISVCVCIIIECTCCIAIKSSKQSIDLFF